MSKLLNALLDEGADAALRMVTSTGVVKSSIVTFRARGVSNSGSDLQSWDQQRAIVMEVPTRPARAGDLADQLRGVIDRLDPVAYGYIAPAWVPYRAGAPLLVDGVARHRDGVHISAVDRVGHRMSRTYRIDRDLDGLPTLTLVPELSGFSQLSDLATTILDEAPARIH